MKMPCVRTELSLQLQCVFRHALGGLEVTVIERQGVVCERDQRDIGVEIGEFDGGSCGLAAH